MPGGVIEDVDGTGAVGAVPDEDQRAAIAHDGRFLRVLGAPGSGRTTVAVELLLARIATGRVAADRAVLLAPTRRGAGTLRDELTARLRGATRQPLARTVQSLAFGLLREGAAVDGAPAPRLLSGPEQEAVVAELLAGHAAEGTGPRWPSSLGDATRTRAFRRELRDLLMRAVEHDVEPAALAELGRVHGRPEWVAGAAMLAEYDEVTALSAPGALDPAWVVGRLLDAIEEDPAAADRAAAAVGLVVVDDAQELTPPGWRLVRTLGRLGAEVVLVGDPDAAVQGFRGAEPEGLLEPWPGERPQDTVVLRGRYRVVEGVAPAVARLVERIGVIGRADHRAGPDGVAGRGSLAVEVFRSPAQEAAAVATRLRSEHLERGVPWQSMVVVCRGRSRTEGIRRALAGHGVPVVTAAADLPLRDEPAVRPLMALFDVVVARARDPRAAVAPEVALDALTSPLGGADPVTLRRLRRGLRADELAAGGARTSDELLVAGLLGEVPCGHLGPEAAPLARLAAVVEAGAAVAVRVGDGPMARWAPSATAEAILWAMWDASGLAEPWRRTALAGGVAGARADRDLDALVALFDTAARFEDRLPLAGPERFAEYLEVQEVAADSVARTAQGAAGVEVLTPQGVTGREWDVVVVAGLQDGAWPDLRLRGSLLRSEQLVSVVRGRPDDPRSARARILHDETRLLHVALTRSRGDVLVTAARSEEEQPSPYLSVLDPLPEGEDRRVAEPPVPLTLAGLVTRLRRTAAGVDPGDELSAEAAGADLAVLAASGVAGARPDQWWALRTVSDRRPLRGPEDVVRVSPSAVETFGTCRLRWLLTSHGGDGPPVGTMTVGTMVHDLAHELGDVDGEAYVAALDERWPQLGLGRSWADVRTRSQVEDMLRRVARYHADAQGAGWERHATEVAADVTIGRARVVARLDRVEATADGSVRIVDWKTGATAVTKDDARVHPQLGTYQAVVEAGGITGPSGSATPPVAGASLVYVGKPANSNGAAIRTQGPLAEADDPRWAVDLIARTAEGMAGEVFPATANDRCATCPVRTSCPLQPEGRSLT